MNQHYDMLRRIAEPMEMDVSRETFERFVLYKNLLQEWNQHLNLTAIIDDDGIFLKHFADSITIFRLNEVKQSKSVIDVGTGAGFPGLPMKILDNSIELTCLDPLNKRLTFLKEVTNQLGLAGVHFIHGRAEDVSRETSHRDHYDLAVSRAVAVLPTLMEFCLPFVAPNHYFVAMKGPGIDAEVKLNPKLFHELSSSLVKIEQVPDLDEYEHNLVLIKKTNATSSNFPRKFAQIKKDTERYKTLLGKS
ncbi:Ribosomal RNA small subunit methyltransferase G [anaerobic digester metagenome]